jgi:hypothetical protein
MSKETICPVGAEDVGDLRSSDTAPQKPILRPFQGGLIFKNRTTPGVKTPGLVL